MTSIQETHRLKVHLMKYEKAVAAKDRATMDACEVFTSLLNGIPVTSARVLAVQAKLVERLGQVTLDDEHSEAAPA